MPALVESVFRTLKYRPGTRRHRGALRPGGLIDLHEAAERPRPRGSLLGASWAHDDTPRSCISATEAASVGWCAHPGAAAADALAHERRQQLSRWGIGEPQIAAHAAGIIQTITTPERGGSWQWFRWGG